MLILGRKEGEAFTLILPNGDKVEITLAEYVGQETKVSIHAPDDVLILRNELLDKSVSNEPIQNNKVRRQSA